METTQGRRRAGAGKRSPRLLFWILLATGSLLAALALEDVLPAATGAGTNRLLATEAHAQAPTSAPKAKKVLVLGIFFRI